MRDTRSSSQILFGFLPQQTVDVKGRIWKVREWRSPRHLGVVDERALSKELRRAAVAWRARQNDGNFVNDLERGFAVQFLALDRKNGVNLDPFPRIWYCRRCRLLHRARSGRCRCGGAGDRSQLHFVAYHDACGEVREPRLPACPQHGSATINFPGTASAREIHFSCSQCNWTQAGFPHMNCTCGQGAMTVNVHRSASVFTPRQVVIVNPPRREDVQRILEQGGSTRALAWVLEGIQEQSLENARPTASSLRRQLLGQGMPEAAIDAVIRSAGEAGGLAVGSVDLEALAADKRAEAEDQALAIALAASSSRTRVADLIGTNDQTADLQSLYRNEYPAALTRAGLESVELVDKFPILTGHFGYTRGDPAPGESKLVTFKDRRGDYVVYGDLAQTEALFFRLSATRVVRWLERQGFNMPRCPDERTARLAIIERADIPAAGAQVGAPTIGTEVLRLVHSFCHRTIRILAVHAGIERSALSEYLVPVHLGFYVYAAAKGDFVLGGLQAVFESELNTLLRDVVYGEHRCALDPGCASVDAACMSCLHLGEPSCRYWNTFLTREALFGPAGYFHEE